MSLVTLANLDVIVLAGGLGTRLQGSIEAGLPKALAPISGEPFLYFQLAQLIKAGAQSVIFALGFGAEKIRQYLESAELSGIEVQISVETEPLGTGGAVKLAATIARSDHVVVINGDTLATIDFSNFINNHISTDAAISIALTTVDNASNYGTVSTNSCGQVLSFCEKLNTGQPGKVSAGVYLIKRHLIDEVFSQQCSIEQDIFPRLTQRGLYGFEVVQRFIDIGTPVSLKNAANFVNK